MVDALMLCPVGNLGVLLAVGLVADEQASAVKLAKPPLDGRGFECVVGVECPGEKRGVGTEAAGVVGHREAQQPA
jgi:hypothetical protein